MGVENEVGETERSEGGGGEHRGTQFEIAEVEDQREELDLRSTFGFLESVMIMKEPTFKSFTTSAMSGSTL